MPLPLPPRPRSRSRPTTTHGSSGLPPAPAGTASERARLLVQAIRTSKPELAAPFFFFPQKAFRRVKAMGNPERGLTHPERVELVGFKLSRRVRWTPRGKEANALPYWDAYESEVLVRDGARTRAVTFCAPRALRVRMMITWDDQWYVTHLTRMK